MRVLGLLLLALSCTTLTAQIADSGLTLHATATTVVVDVVVKDKDHHAVHGLTQADFTLSEDKKPQTIAAFEEHTARNDAIPLPKMPPGVFTNMAIAPASSAVNIILIDTLNYPAGRPGLHA